MKPTQRLEIPLRHPYALAIRMGDLPKETELIDGGIHVKDLNEHYCVDILRMIFSHRIAVSENFGSRHVLLDSSRYFCFPATVWTIREVYEKALAYDGDTDPEGYIKKSEWGK